MNEYTEECNFNPRSYKRSDIYSGKNGSHRENFNPRSYKRSDEKIHTYAAGRFEFQSTLLQEERRSGEPYTDENGVFQSTLLQEERRYSICVFESVRKNFNPRSYKRSDHFLCDSHVNHVDFNPRSYKRSDTVSALHSLMDWRFQSTLLQEERRQTAENQRDKQSYFNPRSYKRSDLSGICI